MKKRSKRYAAAAMCAALLCSGNVRMPVTALELSPVQTVQAQADTLMTRDGWCANEDVNRWESEHFQFIWGKNGADSAQITESFLQENAKNLEACWDVYMNDLAMEPPTQSVNLALRDGNEYKLNLYISGTGLAAFPDDDWAYMGYDKQGYAFMFCCVGAMQNSPNPSWVLPHEFGHAVTAHQRGWNENKYVQSWWEAIGNWFREQFLYSDYYSQWVTDPASGTDYFETYMKNLCFTPILGRDNYASWAFLQYLTENPDNLEGYGSDFIKNLMQQGQRDEYPYLEIDRLAAADLKETLGHYAKRLATLDLKMQERYQARQNELFDRGEYNWGEIYTLLEKTGAAENYYTVPTERAPQQFGINIIPLTLSDTSISTVAGSTISVTLEGLTDVKGADWRACIVAQKPDGSTQYSDLFRAGETMQMQVGKTDTLYLTVTATPDLDTIQQIGVPWAYGEGEFDENHCPFLGKTRYPYAVTIEGADIQQTRTTGAFAQGSQHANGGGFVAASAKVDASVYVGPNARVLGNATVTGNARIDGYATVTGSAQVSGNAVVTGHAVVAERAKVQDNAIVGDYAGVMGNAVVSDYARVIESGLVFDNYKVSGNATVKGVAYCLVGGSASGQAIADGDYYDDSGRSLSAGSVFGWTSPDAYVNSRPYTDGMVAGLEFGSDSSRIAEDTYTSTYAAAQNSPTWEAERTSGKGVLTFDPDQYLIADSSYAMLHDAEYQTAVLLRDELLNVIFCFGEDEKHLTLAAFDGQVVFVINDGKELHRLAIEDVYVPGEWMTISVSLIGDEAKLTVNNGSETKTVTETVTADPIDIVSENAQYHIGGNETFRMTGSMDYFRVFFKDVEDADYYYTETENVEEVPGSDVGSKGIVGDVNFDGKIDVIDLVLLKRHVLNIPPLSTVTTEYTGDCDGSGKISVGDVVALQKYLLSAGSDKTKIGQACIIPVE